jgi:hypothetical protein
MDTSTTWRNSRKSCWSSKRQQFKPERTWYWRHRYGCLRPWRRSRKKARGKNDSRVKELMEKLTAMEMALAMEKIKYLEFEAALVIERQNKRRATDFPEDARGGKTRSTDPAQHEDHISIPVISVSSSVVTMQRVCPITGNRYTVHPMSASGLPVSRKFSPPLIMSTRSKDRKPPQKMIDAMMAPPPIPTSQQIQPANSTIHQIPKGYHNRQNVPPHRGPHQPIHGCLEEKDARPKTLPARIRNTQRRNVRVLFEAALFGVEEPLHLVGELPKRRHPRGQAWNVQVPAGHIQHPKAV